MIEAELIEILLNEEKVQEALDGLLREASKEGFELDFNDPEIRSAVFFLAGRRYERKQCANSRES